MKKKSIISTVAMTFLISTPVFSGDISHNHQEMMQSKMNEMEGLISEMSQADKARDVKAAMKKHSQVMAETIQLSKEMIDAKRTTNERCIEEEKLGGEDSQTCYSVETHADTAYKQLVVLLQHVIQRQNIIMDKMNMLSDSKNKSSYKR